MYGIVCRIGLYLLTLLTTLKLGSISIGTTRILTSLPTHVITAVSVDTFKNRLDKFWANEEARFNYKANLSGSGFATCS